MKKIFLKLLIITNIIFSFGLCILGITFLNFIGITQESFLIIFSSFSILFMLGYGMNKKLYLYFDSKKGKAEEINYIFSIFAKISLTIIFFAISFFLLYQTKALNFIFSLASGILMTIFYYFGFALSLSDLYRERKNKKFIHIVKAIIIMVFIVCFFSLIILFFGG